MPADMKSTAQDGVATVSADLQAQALAEFTLFPKLPIELRLKIFKHALPTGPNGLRMLRVAADNITIHSTTNIMVPEERIKAVKSMKAKSRLTFRLIPGHEHHDYIRDVALLGACSESRRVYLEYFSGCLRVRGKGLIRFGREDIVYIVNIIPLLQTYPTEQSLLQKNSGFEGVPCQNLALPTRCFWEGWHHIWDPDYKTSRWIRGELVRFLSGFKHIKTVGPVWDDFELVYGEEEFEAWQEAYAPGQSEWDQVVAKDVDEIRTLLEKSNSVRNKECKMPELCVWDRDGNRVEHEKTGNQASNTA